MSKKIFLIGDTHIGLGYPNTTDKWHKVHIEYFRDFLIPLLKKEVKEGDIIVHLGDLFDNRNIIPINLLNYGMDVVEEISKILPKVALCGFGGIPFKMIDNVLYWCDNILKANIIQNHIFDALGLSAILTYTNKKNKTLVFPKESSLSDKNISEKMASF